MSTIIDYSLRFAKHSDEDFQCKVYADTRAAELAQTDWSDEQKSAFLRMQFEAQVAHYRTYYPNADYYVIERDGAALGRLIVNRSTNELLIIDIALLVQYCNAGIGTAILNDIKEEARRAALPIVLRVEFFNPAIKLYTRLGFLKTREVNSVYHEMIWNPEG